MFRALIIIICKSPANVDFCGEFTFSVLIKKLFPYTEVRKDIIQQIVGGDFA